MPLQFFPFLLKHVPTLNPTYLLFSTIMITLVEKFEKQSSEWLLYCCL